MSNKLKDITPIQRVRVAVLCALKFYTEPEWTDWAHRWLSGERVPVDMSTYRTAHARSTSDPGAVTAVYAMDSALQLYNGCSENEVALGVACSLQQAHRAAYKNSEDPLMILQSGFDLIGLVQQGLNMGEPLKDCHDCGVTPGRPHEPGCDVERCSVCGLQRMTCGCEGHDPAFARWTGIWPGKAEIEYLGLRDLNVLYEGDLYRVLFVKPLNNTDKTCSAGHGYCEFTLCVGDMTSKLHFGCGTINEGKRQCIHVGYPHSLAT